MMATCQHCLVGLMGAFSKPRPRLGAVNTLLQRTLAKASAQLKLHEAWAAITTLVRACSRRSDLRSQCRPGADVGSVPMFLGWDIPPEGTFRGEASGSSSPDPVSPRSPGRASATLSSVFGAQGGTRTHTSRGHRNLNPACLPVPTPGHGFYVTAAPEARAPGRGQKRKRKFQRRISQCRSGVVNGSGGTVIVEIVSGSKPNSSSIAA